MKKVVQKFSLNLSVNEVNKVGSRMQNVVYNSLERAL